MNVDLEIAQSAKYNDYYNANTHLVEHTFLQLLDKIRDFFPGLPDNITIKIRPIKSKLGYFTAGNSIGASTIELDCRSRDIRKLADTIAHEFCHMQQKNENRLAYTYNGSKRVREWVTPSGERIHYPTKDHSHQEYLALPWEVEAREKAAEFVSQHTFLIHEITLEALSIKSYRERKRK